MRFFTTASQLSFTKCAFFCPQLYIHPLDKKMFPPKNWFFLTKSSLLHKHEFSWICLLYGGKITRGIQIFNQNFCYSSILVPILLLVFMRKSVKPPCVHTNPNYNQGTPGPLEQTGIIDLMMFSPSKKPIPKNFSQKRVTFIREIALKSRLFRFFVIFRDF